MSVIGDSEWPVDLKETQVSRIEDDSRVRVDARTFQEPLAMLSETLAQKVKREAAGRCRGPEYVWMDIHVLVRQALSTYNLLFYINADERRKNDCNWREIYSVATAPLVRSMIDCLYNITAILQDPTTNGPAFRKSGLKRSLEDIDEDQQKYGGRPKWDDFVAERRKNIKLMARVSGFTLEEVRAQKPWVTLGRYVSSEGPGKTLTPHQKFLKTFTHRFWRQYSALAHGSFEGLIGPRGEGVAPYYTIDSLPHELRPKVEASYDEFVSLHLGRAATVLICIITELQSHFLFEGANINERIEHVWKALIPLFDAKELYDERYAALMNDLKMSS